MTINAGDLTEKITIKSPPDLSNPANRNSYNDVIGEWPTFAVRKASMTKLSGGESEAAKQIQAVSTYEFKLRYLAGVNTKQKIVVGEGASERTLDIVNVDNVKQRNRELVITATEG